MTEPLRVNPNVHQVIISLDEVEEATGLRELAGYLDTLDVEYLLHSVTYHAGDQHDPSGVLTALVEDLSPPEGGLPCGNCPDLIIPEPDNGGTGWVHLIGDEIPASSGHRLYQCQRPHDGSYGRPNVADPKPHKERDA